MAKNTDPNKEPDSIYVFKIVLYLVLGSLWLRIISAGGTEIPVPVGALLGLLFIAHDHFKIDRKIEYAVLLLAMSIGFWLPMGIDLKFN